MPRLPLQDQIRTARVLARAGMLQPIRPDRLARVGLAVARFGPGLAAGVTAAAIRHPEQPAIIDETGILIYEELDQRTNALAHALSDRGVLEGDGIALLARNHRGFVETAVAASKLGAHCLYLNTSFAGPQAAEVLEREKPRAVVYDAEFTELMDEATSSRRTKRFVAHTADGDPPARDETLATLIEGGDTRPVIAPSEPGRTIILTSGTTGPPRGASRSNPASLGPAAAVLERVPLHAREATLIAAPLFHAWGGFNFQAGVALASTAIFQRRFDPKAVLAAIDRHRPASLVVVPVMLQRMLELDTKVRASYDTSSLRVVFASGSAVGGELAKRFMDAYGDILYNLYGSTEIAYASIATPAEMRTAPGTAGRAPTGVRLAILDEAGHELPAGEIGRIFVGHELMFEGYTDGRTKEVVDGMMSAGDVGHLDEAGRLFVDSREDDMIVSGGENVYPGEVEELLGSHPAVEEVAVVGVEDERFGQRLKAVVVKRRGARLTADEVRAHVKKRLAAYKVPRDVEFVKELPRNATGKVLKRELR